MTYRRGRSFYRGYPRSGEGIVRVVHPGMDFPAQKVCPSRMDLLTEHLGRITRLLAQAVARASD